MIPSATSRVISTLRFPLMVGVVFIHSRISSDEAMPVLSVLVNLFTTVFPKFCVPLFAFFSGYLFFGTSQSFTVRSYGKKIKKRFRTLVVPYFIWNVLAIAVFWGLHRFMPSLINPEFEDVANYPPHGCSTVFGVARMASR